MKKSKILIRAGIVIGILVVCYLAVRLTGGLRFFASGTSANSPTIEVNDYLVVSNWVSPKRFDFVCYEAVDPFFGPGVFTHRLCGLANDTVEIIDGKLFVNGHLTDYHLNVKYNFRIPSYNSDRVLKIKGVDFLGLETPESSDYVLVSMSPKLVKPWMQSERVLNSPGSYLHQGFPSTWTLNNFGPLVIPEGKIFLLGDNRDNSVDSRTRGLTDERSITGVVLNIE